jgi:RNA polymerase sigma-70 factor, ECF subfamily
VSSRRHSAASSLSGSQNDDDRACTRDLRGWQVLTASERELLKAARRGDDDAFGRLAGPYRGELYAHCYRMLGSAADAEDALQETLLRAWRALPRFEGRSSVRSWFYKIATNTCLRAIERRPRRVLPVDYGPAADPHDGPAEPVTEAVWLEPYPDERLGLGSGPASPEARYEQREGVELAFIAALQHLPARQRAVLILRDVLGFSARETATALETTPVSVDSALQRAHKTVDQRLPEQSQQATLRSLSDDALRQVVQRYVTAWERNDVDAVVAMLAEDAKLAMPPLPTWYRGRDQVAIFLRGGPLAGATRWRLIPSRANGQLAFGLYAWDDKTQTFTPRAVDVLTLRGTQIQEITAFLTPDAFRNFDLPAILAASGTNS